jgi:hypothetical protein
MKLSREQVYLACAAFLFAGMLVLAWSDLYAVRLLITERNAWIDESRDERQGMVLRAVRGHDGDGGGADLVAGDP